MQPSNNIGINYQDADQANQPVAAVAKPSGNWLTHLLPTGGAMAGGAGGAAIGTMILPGIGTVAGGILGAALGGGESKAIENGLEHQSIGNGVASSAIEGGAGQALGGIAGKALGKGAELLANRARNITGATKLAEGTASDLENSKVLNAIYGGSKNDVGKAADIAQQSGLDMTTPGQLHEAGNMLLNHAGQTLDNIVGTTKVPISGVVNETGGKVAPSIDDLIHSSLTNTNPLTGEKVGASRSLVLGGLGPDQTDEDLLRNGYTRFLSSSAKNGANTPATNYLKEANQLLSGVNHGSEASAHDLLDAQRLVGDKAHTMALAAAKPSANEVTQAQADAWKDLNHHLQDMIYSHPDVSQAAKEMVGTHTAEDFGGNQQLADLFNSRITGAQSGKDLNALMHDAYNLRDVGADGLSTVNNPASTGNLQLSQLNSADAIAAAKGQDPAMLNMASDTHGSRGIVGTALAVGKHAVNNPNLLDTMARIGDLGSKLAPATGVALATTPNLAADPVPVSATMGAMNNAAPGQPLPGQQQPNSLQAYINAMEAQSVLAPALNPGATSFMGSIAPALQHNQLLRSEMNSLPASFANAGGAQGTGGIFDKVWGQINPASAAGQYSAQQQAVAKALGIDPSVLPQVMQNQNTAGVSQDIMGQLQGQLVY